MPIPKGVEEKSTVVLDKNFDKDYYFKLIPNP